MEYLPPPLRWFLLCLLSGPILFAPLVEFHWMELICLEMMEFHLGPWWGKIAVFIESFPPLLMDQMDLLIWNFLPSSVLLSKPMMIVWLVKFHPLLFDQFLCQRIIIFFKCLIIQTNDNCLVCFFFVQRIIIFSHVIFFVNRTNDD